MRALVLLFICIVLTIIFGAILAYPFKIVFDPVFDLAYRKYLTYSTLTSGLIISALYLKHFSLLSIQSLGYDQKPVLFIKGMIQGCIAGILIMLFIESVLLSIGIHAPDPSRSATPTAVMITLLGAVLAALVISFIEETIFRGALFSGLHQQNNAVIAVLVTALIYAAVHFIRYRDLPPGTEVHLFIAFEMMPQAFRRFSDPIIIDYFLTLTMFGVLLGLIRLRSNNISRCIGLHTGVVTVMKLSRHFTNSAYSQDYPMVVNRYNDMFGWFAFTTLLLITLMYYWFSRKNNRII